MLTWELVQHAGRVIAVELDKRLAERLRDEFRATANLQVIQADVMKIQAG